MTFAQNKIPPMSCAIRSIATEVMSEEPEAYILCISPIETAADKLSTLTWRVLVRDRQAQDDDPTLVRHLHDLAALHDETVKHREMFVTAVHQSLEQDRTRRGGELIANLTPQERIDQAIKILETDQLYRVEYDQFVQDMSYSDQDQRISFDLTVTLLKQIAQIVLAA